MTVTVTSFREALPAFASLSDFPDPLVTFWLNIANLRHNAERWGDLLDFGVQLFTAHNLSLDLNARKAAASGQGAGQVVGALSSISAKGVSWTRDTGISANPGDGHWNLTIYGQQWIEMAKMMGAGGLYSGVPSPDELTTGQAWPGPFPNLW
jgi:hypothetical protein